MTTLPDRIQQLPHTFGLLNLPPRYRVTVPEPEIADAPEYDEPGPIRVPLWTGTTTGKTIRTGSLTR